MNNTTTQQAEQEQQQAESRAEYLRSKAKQTDYPLFDFQAEQEHIQTIEQEPSQEQEQTLTIQAIDSELLFKQQDKTIIYSIKECERFIQFLNKKFQLGIRNDLIIIINETKPNTRGMFRPTCWNGKPNGSIWKTENEIPLNSIVLSSHILKDKPYLTLAHETAHYVNFIRGIKDTTKNGIYHNKKFQTQAESLFLKVESMGDSRGFTYTSSTPQFEEMLKEFEPSQDAFKVLQEISDKKKKVGSRLLLFECLCGDKIRVSRQVGNGLQARCEKCDTLFEEVIE